jgi:hypothetical protein
MREPVGKFALTLHPEKTRLIKFGRFAAERHKRRALSKPETFNFRTSIAKNATQISAPVGAEVFSLQGEELGSNILRAPVRTDKYAPVQDGTSEFGSPHYCSLTTDLLRWALKRQAAARGCSGWHMNQCIHALN